MFLIVSKWKRKIFLSWRNFSFSYFSPFSIFLPYQNKKKSFIFCDFAITRWMGKKFSFSSYNRKKSKTTEVNCFFTSDYNDTIRWLKETASKDGFLNWNGLRDENEIWAYQWLHLQKVFVFIFAHPSIVHPYKVDT